MNTDIPNRILLPIGESDRLNIATLEDSVHVFPATEPRHHTRQCWCNPEITEDVETGLPMFVHKQFH